ncbi:iron ABC transporter, partial [Bacillus vallismortis]|nr:iron ABC transporter [Bacillus vallismortis]
YFFATWLNVSISGAMAAMTGVWYAVALLFSPANGVMTKKIRTLNMRKESAG